MLLEKLKQELSKDIQITTHIKYAAYNRELTIANCKSDWLKENFSEWNNVPYFVFGIYNMAKLLPDMSVKEFKNKIREIEHNFKFNKTYFEEDEYYADIGFTMNSCWDECCLTLMKGERNCSKENLIPLSRLKEYLIEHPNRKCYPVFCYDIPEDIMNNLIKQGLVEFPDEDEVALS